MINKQIVLIEDDAIIAKTLVFLLKSKCNLPIIHFFNAEDAISALKVNQECIILMDINLPGINGIEATFKIKQTLKRVDIIMVTSEDDSDLVFESLKAGAVGYITKDDIHTNIVPAILQCISGGAPMSAKIARMVTTSFRQNVSSTLSERETEVIRQLSEGETYTQIAAKLFIAPATVRTHIKNIYVKLFVNSKSEAIKAAKDQRII